jgi:hypothetical protein
MVLAAESVGELVETGAGDNGRAFPLETLDGGGRDCRGLAIEPRATGGRQALLIDDVLDGHCHSRQAAAVTIGCDFLSDQSTSVQQILGGVKILECVSDWIGAAHENSMPFCSGTIDIQM